MIVGIIEDITGNIKRGSIIEVLNIKLNQPNARPFLNWSGQKKMTEQGRKIEKKLNDFKNQLNNSDYLRNLLYICGMK